MTIYRKGHEAYFDWTGTDLQDPEHVGDRSASAHEANLFDLDAKYVDVFNLEDELKYAQNL